MTAIEASPVSLPESGLVKMEDRKRPAAYDNDSAPPLKKQATSLNGGGKPHPDTDMPWKDDLEVSERWDIDRQGCTCGLDEGFYRRSMLTVSFNSAFRRMRYGARCRSINAKRPVSKPS